MAKIFISGVAGFLGSHLADRMIQNGHEVVGNDTLEGGYKDNLNSKVDFHEVDCIDFHAMLKLTKDVDIVYHTAAFAYEGLSVFSPYIVTKNIFQNTMALLSAAIQNKVKRFVYCSSMARYGENKVPFTEDMIPKPQDPYGIAKVAGEDEVKLLCDIHGVEWVIAVPHNIIGPRQKYDDPFRNVASIMINLMLQGRQPIIYGDGEQMRCFSFVQDCVDVLEKMAFDEKAKSQIVNIGPDEEFVTINELAKTIAELLDFKLNPEFYPDRPQEVKHATCSADKARNLFGYETKYSLKEGLKEMIDWIKHRGAKPFNYHIPLEILNKKTPKTWSEKKF